MEGGGGVFDDSRMPNVLLKNERVSCTSEVLDSLWGAPNSSPSFHGSASMVSFEEIRGESNPEKPFFTQVDSKSGNCNEDLDGCFHPPEKKRRLSSDQVQFLEKSFEVENKLEPERKVELAKELGLQPRQVAIWFQNRRARYKTKVLEKEYDSLKASYDKLKSDYDNVFKENEKMRNEVKLMTEKMEEKGKALLQTEKVILLCAKEDGASSDVLDSESPHCCTDGNHSASLEPANSSHVVESEFSQDEDDSLPPMCFPKLEIECYDDLHPNSCNLGFPVQDHGTWFWQY
ncbi:hypothetical protein ACS0TY_010085 [Phlomoides rotata]